MMKTHYDAPKSESFDVQQPMKKSFEAGGEQNTSVYIFYTYIS